MTEDTATVAVEPTMVLAGISKHYDGVAALTDVSLDIRPGEVHALLGENGAGKSTLMGIASGTTLPDAGTITVRGRLVERLSPREATELGIAIVHQHPAVAPGPDRGREHPARGAPPRSSARATSRPRPCAACSTTSGRPLISTTGWGP